MVNYLRKTHILVHFKLAIDIFYLSNLKQIVTLMIPFHVTIHSFDLQPNCHVHLSILKIYSMYVVVKQSTVFILKENIS